MLLKACLCLSLLVYVSCQGGGRKRNGQHSHRRFTNDGMDFVIDGGQQFPYKFTGLEIDMMQKFVAATPDKSIAFSPLSVRSVLSMLLEGAGGETQRQLSKVVGDANSLKSIMNSPLKTGISMGNAFYLSNTKDISESFKNALTDGFSAEFQYADFSRSDKAAYNINEWVKRITKKNIDKVVDNLSGDTVFLMANAIHLVGKWRDPFESIETRDGVFYSFEKSGNSSTGVNLIPKLTPIMRQTNGYKIGHVRSLEARVVEIPFRTPENHAMYVVLPDRPDGLKDLVGNITNAALGEIVSSLAFNQHVTLWLPKFSGSIQRKLRGLLPEGMQDLFGDSADFSKISTNSNVKINEITHKAVLKVDEEGAVGSASTVAEAINLNFTPTTIFNVTHPFMYFIAESSERDFSSRSPKNMEIYFMGFVGKLEQSKSIPADWGILPTKDKYVKETNVRQRRP